MKNKRGKVIIFCILVLFVIGIGAYFYINAENKNFNVIKDNKQNKVIINLLDNDFLQKDFEISLNGKKHTLTYIYTKKVNNAYVNSDTYDIYTRIYFDSELVVFDLLIESEIQEIDNFIPITNDINILKGIDKEYLVINIKEDNPEFDTYYCPYIVNEEGKLIKKFDFNNGNSLSIIDEERSKKYVDSKKYFIEDNVLYYLEIKDSNYDEEKVLINENKVIIDKDEVRIELNKEYIGYSAGAAL